jgi:excisionase family DNA binding protein
MSAGDGADEPDDDSPTGVFVRPATNAAPSRRPAQRSHATQGQIRDSEMLTVKEAAHLLRVNIKTVYLEIAAGRLKHVQLGRRIIRIPRSVIASLTSKSA